LYDKAYALENPSCREFLRKNFNEKEKWAWAYEFQVLRYGDMTNTMAECFKSLLNSVHALPVLANMAVSVTKGEIDGGASGIPEREDGGKVGPRIERR
jgi:hypothetical protein